MGDIIKAVKWATAIAHDNIHGYSQQNRQGVDYDCSSLVANALAEGGFPIDRNSWTGNLKQQLLACGFTYCSAPWKLGDIHLNELHHVNMSVNETHVVNASSNYDGVTGDSSGKEIEVKKYYEYSKGWDCHLRAPSQIEDIIDKPLEVIATYAIQGKFGNGDERILAITNKTMFTYEQVQRIVNIYYSDQHDKYMEVAKDIICGVYGDGDDRKKALENAGYLYEVAQTFVNITLWGLN